MNKNTEKKTTENKPLSSQKWQAIVTDEDNEKFSETKNKFDKKLDENTNYSKETFAQCLATATSGLNYISETDAEIFPFVGKKSSEVTSNSLLSQIDADLDSTVEERDFESFFQHITKIQDWHNEERIQTTKNFQNLEEVLKENLTDLKVFNIGQIQIDVYVVGLDTENNLMGIKTKAIET